MKLTPAQKRELLDLSTRPCSRYADDYSPIKRLLTLGYVDRDGDGAYYGHSSYIITPAGRRALTEEQG